MIHWSLLDYKYEQRPSFLFKDHDAVDRKPAVPLNPHLSILPWPQIPPSACQSFPHLRHRYLPRQIDQSCHRLTWLQSVTQLIRCLIHDAHENINISATQISGHNAHGYAHHRFSDELGTHLGPDLRISRSYDFHALRLCTYALIDRQTNRGAPSTATCTQAADV